MERSSKGRKIVSPVSASGEQPEPPAREWKNYFWEGGASAHVQALAAVFAVGYAVWTVTSWKEQEVSKRRSELAYEILRRVGEVDKGGYWSDYGYSGDIGEQKEESFDDFLARIMGSEDRKQNEQLKLKMDELELYGAIATITFKNFKLDTAMESMIASIRRGKGCYDALAEAAKVPAAQRLGKWSADVTQLAAGLGFEREGVKEKVKAKSCGDTARDYEHAKRIKEMLIPELEMSDRLAEEGPDRSSFWDPNEPDPK